MEQSLAQALFQSRARTEVLRLVLVDGQVATMSELARRAGLSPRAIAKEVALLRALGLVRLQSVGAADVVSGNPDHPGAPFLRGLLQIPAKRPEDPDRRKRVRESLAAHGAPLAGVDPVAHFKLEATLVEALDLARHDGTVLRVLPVVLAKHRGRLDWLELKEAARRRKLKAELGMLVELTAELLGDPALKRYVDDLRDRRRRVMRYLPEAKSDFERKLARRRTPRPVRKWGFLMNLGEDSLKPVLEKHLA